MEKSKVRTEEKVLQDKIENLVAIGAAVAANCIPCFEHLYKKAVNSGITLAEIKWASNIAGQMKKGANIALANSVDEIIGKDQGRDLPCNKTMNKSCCSE